MADEINVTRTTATGADGAPGRADDEPGLGELFRQLAQDSATLVRQEMALAKAEMTQNLKAAARDATMVAVGGGVALLGMLVLILFLVLVIGDALNEYWAGALIVGLLFLIIGGVLAMGALKRLKHDSLTPARTIDTLKEDKQWAQSEIKQVRRDLA
ncbi:MAG TPA: phage holin family protein [Longimicrobium sp.]|jgi:uncharacterized membrane protein YqjE